MEHETEAEGFQRVADLITEGTSGCIVQNKCFSLRYRSCRMLHHRSRYPPSWQDLETCRINSISSSLSVLWYTLVTVSGRQADLALHLLHRLHSYCSYLLAFTMAS